MSNIVNKKIDSKLKFVYSDNDTLSVIFQNNNLLLGVVGEFNSNLKELEKITKTNIYSRGNSILIKSSLKKNELVKNAITFLTEQFISPCDENGIFLTISALSRGSQNIRFLLYNDRMLE